MRGKRGFTLAELVVVLALSALVVGMVLTLTLSISGQVSAGKRAEGVALELATLRRVFGERREELLSGAEQIAFDEQSQILTVISAEGETSVSFSYLTAVHTEIKGKALRFVLEFGTEEYALLFTGRI